MSLDSSAEPNTGGRRFTTVRQLELLVEFMEAHKDLALGRVQSKEARALASRLWIKCATICNAEGTFRNPKEWSRYWNDVKGRVKAKLRSISRSMSGTGGGPSMETAMSPIEDRVAAILGRDVVTPLQGVQQNPFQTQNVASSEAPEASQENHVEENETIDMNVVEELYNIVDIVQPDSDVSEAPLTSAQPSQINQPEQSIPHSARRARGRAPSRNLQLQQAESATEESRAIFVRLEEEKIKFEEKRLEMENRKVEALKEIALAINRLGDKLSSSEHGHGHPKKKRRVSTFSSDSDD